MKKLLLITILIGGCATTSPTLNTTASMRIEICKIDKKDDYWGDCYIQTTLADPNSQKLFAYVKKNSPNAYMQFNLLRSLNDVLVKKLENGEIDTDEANQTFQAKYDRARSVTKREAENAEILREQKREQSALALQQLSEGLSRASATLSGNNSVNNQNNRITPAKLKVSFRLQSSYMNGYQKVCVYAYRTHTQTWTTSSAVTCPSSKHFDNPE